MSKKARRSSTAAGGRKFSIVALHGELERTLRRLAAEGNTPAAARLRSAVKGLQNAKAMDCGQTMLVEL